MASIKINGYTLSKGRFCHAVISGVIFSTILLTSPSDMLLLYYFFVICAIFIFQTRPREDCLTKDKIPTASHLRTLMLTRKAFRVQNIEGAYRFENRCVRVECDNGDYNSDLTEISHTYHIHIRIPSLLCTPGSFRHALWRATFLNILRSIMCGGRRINKNLFLIILKK